MLKPGDLVGPYEIHGFVGQGGMGQVYRAFDPRLERMVALKVIVVPEGDGPAPPRSPEDSARISGEFSARLLREARAVASLNHPNVVAIYDVGESKGRLYLAMEYVVGSTLRGLVKSSDVALGRKVRWLVDIARALDAAHRKGIIHRDVKPENVMVREDGSIKVLDFGIARRATSKRPEDQHVIDTVTGAGTIAGTPVYMAPEQIKGGDVDARCDQFAWGVMGYELLAGERPWPDTGDVLSLVARVLTEPPRSLREKIEHVPAVVEETLLRALSREAHARFPTMADAADALEPFASHTTGDRVRITPPANRDEPAAYAATTRVPTTKSVPTAPPEVETTRTPRRRVAQLVLPLVLLAALGGAVVWVKTKSGPSGGPTGTTSAARPLSMVPEAEAAYREAVALFHDGAEAKSMAALTRAVEHDRTFAAAHLEMAIQQASANDIQSAQQSFQLAFEHRHTLLPRDAALLDASEPFVRGKPDLEEWETRMTAVVFQHPRDPELQLLLGRARERQGDDAGAKTAYAAAVRLKPAFAPGLAALAKVERSMGRVKEALAAADECLKRSPIASMCVQTKHDILEANGDCHAAREEAARWASLEPQSPRPYAALARGLLADGAPRPSIDEALAHRWSLLPADEKAVEELWDRASLAVLDGELTQALDLARDYDAALRRDADVYDRSAPARLRVNILLELDRAKDAAKVARSFLDRMAAWTPYAFAPDPSIAFYEPLYRAGEMTLGELEEKRKDWLEKEKIRLANEDLRMTWIHWVHLYGGFAETRDEAISALSRLPDAPLPIPARRALVLDFALGKVNALAGKPAEAIPHLERVVATCHAFDDAALVVRARLYLAQAQEARGQPAAAKASYEKILRAWPRTSGSKTVKRAEDRLSTMSRE